MIAIVHRTHNKAVGVIRELDLDPLKHMGIGVGENVMGYQYSKVLIFSFQRDNPTAMQWLEQLKSRLKTKADAKNVVWLE